MKEIIKILGVMIMLQMMIIIMIVRKKTNAPKILVKKLLTYYMGLIKMLRSFKVMYRMSSVSRMNKGKILIKFWVLLKKTKKV